MLAHFARRCFDTVTATDRFALALLAGFLSLNVSLGRNYRTDARGAASSVGVPAGMRLPPLVAKGLDGGPRAIRYDADGRTTVVYVFSPKCVWCTKNLANIKTLIAERRREYHFIGVATSGTAEDLTAYLAREQLDFEVVRDVAPETKSAYRLSGTPQTIAIDRKGTVLRSWPGAYSGSAATEIEQFFRIRLPGLADDDR